MVSADDGNAVDSGDSNEAEVLGALSKSTYELGVFLSLTLLRAARSLRSCMAHFGDARWKTHPNVATRFCACFIKVK